MKTSKLIGPALNWAVHVARGNSMANCDYWLKKYENEDRRHMCEAYSTDWSQGGPIIEREKIGTLWEARNVWSASTKWDDPAKVFYGKTKLIAAMRCYVASKLGDEVEIPEELK